MFQILLVATCELCVVVISEKRNHQNRLQISYTVGERLNFGRISAQSWHRTVQTFEIDLSPIVILQ